jgi:hypothetical protein
LRYPDSYGYEYANGNGNGNCDADRYALQWQPRVMDASRQFPGGGRGTGS